MLSGSLSGLGFVSEASLQPAVTCGENALDRYEEESTTGDASGKPRGAFPLEAISRVTREPERKPG